jgi:hypothetical protein
MESYLQVRKRRSLKNAPVQSDQVTHFVLYLGVSSVTCRDLGSCQCCCCYFLKPKQQAMHIHYRESMRLD